MKMIFILCNIFINILVFATGEPILITIPDGTLEGSFQLSRRNTHYYSFLQIPFAKPPVGKLRFQPPQPADKWEGVRDAKSNNKICVQLQNQTGSSYIETEDCLYLNVFTPEHPNLNKSLPVMVYIFGGGFVNGNGNFLGNGPHYLLEDGVVVVCITYRVGPFGFLATGDTTIPGNYGLKDQLLALKWVRDNIKYFNGDPNKATIFGQSAGGASVTFHLMSKQSKGLFRAAISESGSTLCPWAYQRDYKFYAYALATYLNPNFNKSASSRELLEYLQSVPAMKLKEAEQSFKEETYNVQILQGFWFTPVPEPEHENAFITELQYAAIEKGHMNRVPLMIGICSEEQIWWASNLEGLKWNIQYFDGNTSALVNHNMKIKSQEMLTKAGNSIRTIYTPSKFSDKLGLLVRYLSDTAFTRPIITHAKLQSQFSDVYFYEFSYHGKLGNNNIYVEGAERVGHSEDMNYVWVYDNKPNLDTYPANDILASNRYRKLMTNFAKYMNPTPEKSELFENIIWPKVTPTSFQYMDINETLSIKNNPKGDVYPGWVKVYDEYAVKPYDTY